MKIFAFIILLTAIGSVAWTAALSYLGGDPDMVKISGFVGSLLTLSLWAFLDRLPRDHRLRGYRFIAGAAVILHASFVTTHWPLRVAFILYRDEFETHLARIRQHDFVDYPLRVGPFTFEESERTDGLFMDSAVGDCVGFIKSPTVPGNEWSHVRLSANWLLFYED